jgi:hypothetical protein
MSKKVWKVVTEDRESWPGRASVFVYKKGKIVTSPKTQLGIFAFPRKKDAEDHLQRKAPHRCMIISLQPIGRGRKMAVCPAIGANTLRDIATGVKTFTAWTGATWTCAPGTMTYPAVKVLD